MSFDSNQSSSSFLPSRSPLTETPHQLNINFHFSHTFGQDKWRFWFHCAKYMSAIPTSPRCLALSCPTSASRTSSCVSWPLNQGSFSLEGGVVTASEFRTRVLTTILLNTFLSETNLGRWVSYDHPFGSFLPYPFLLQCSPLLQNNLCHHGHHIFHP